MTIRTRSHCQIHRESSHSMKQKTLLIGFLALSVFSLLDTISALTLVSYSVVFGARPLTQKTVFPYLKIILVAALSGASFLAILSHLKPELVGFFASSLMGIILHGFMTFSLTLFSILFPIDETPQRAGCLLAG